MKKSWLILLIVAVVLGGIPSRSSAQEPTPKVCVAINTWMGYVPLFVAKEKGFFKDLQVETFLTDDNAVATAAYDSGRADILFVTGDMLPVTLNQGRKGKCFFITGASSGGDGIIAKPEIKKVTDLKDKRVAFVPGTYSHWFLYLALKSAGMDLRSIRKSEVDTSTSSANAFIGGSADAAVTYEPYLSQVAGTGKGHVLATSRDFADWLPDAWIGSEKFLSHQAWVETFVEGWLRGTLYTWEHPAEAEKIAAKGFRISVEDVRQGMRGCRYATPQQNLRFFKGPDAQGPQLYDEAAAVYLSEGVIKQKPPLASAALTDQATPAFERMAKEFPK